MVRTTLILGALAALLAAGCSKQTERDLVNVWEGARGAFDEAGTAIEKAAIEVKRGVEELVDPDSPARKKFMSDMRARLDGLQEDLSELGEQAAKGSKEAYEAIEELVTDERKARMLLDSLEQTSEERWDDATKAYEKAVDMLDEAVQQTRKKL